MTQELILKRLSYIKHLYTLGVDQSKQPEIISYSSILLFHDSLDMFMQLAAEVKGIPKRHGLYLMDFFNKIPQLTLEASVKKINDRRNSLKHNGQIPAKIEVEESSIISKLFFEQNSKIIFNVEFNEVSLFNLITFESVRTLMLLAETFLTKKDYQSAAGEASKAFNQLMNIYTDFFKKSQSGKHLTKFHSGHQMLRIWKEATLGGKSSLLNDSNFIKVLDLYDSHFERINEELRIIASGVDYNKYFKFKSIAPYVFETYEGWSIEQLHDEYLTEDTIRFLNNFVLDTALKFQEYIPEIPAEEVMIKLS